MSKSETVELTYPLRAAARITGLSPELLRAWERRYRVVVPLRTPGGTRRYRAADLEKLRLVKAAVDAGHRIGNVARMEDDELRRCALNLPATSQSQPQIQEVLAAVERIDSAETQRLLSFQLSALGPVRFARQIARPLVHEIGARWDRGELGIASEHMATSVLRSMFGAALQPSAASAMGPRILFATPSGEPHELGLQMAALTAMGAGADTLYIGADLPVEDLVSSAVQTEAVGVALSLVTIPEADARSYLEALREALPGDVHIWIGGHAATAIETPPGVERIEALDEFERRISLVGYEGVAQRKS
jgi:DNA-binding transcriptional MerR regulator/methylmalonyl-CoA mutase cobalamin-binding subunit